MNVQKLKSYKDLLDSGVITQEEFDKKKSELLGLYVIKGLNVDTTLRVPLYANFHLGYTRLKMPMDR